MGSKYYFPKRIGRLEEKTLVRDAKALADTIGVVSIKWKVGGITTPQTG